MIMPASILDPWTILISDMHIGSPAFEQSRGQFREFLEEYAIYAHRLGILGDALELAGNDFDTILSKEGETLDALNRASENVGINYKLGNHDIDLPDRFRSLFPHISVDEPQWKDIILRKRVGNQQAEPKEVHKVLYAGEEKDGMLFDHGYVYDHYFFDNPHRWHWLVRLGDNIERTAGIAIKRTMAETFRNCLAQMAESGLVPSKFAKDNTIGGPARWLELAARDAALYEVYYDRGEPRIRKRYKPLRVVAFGHTHHQTIKPIYDDILREEGDTGAVYVNTGHCIYGDVCFTVIDRKGRVSNYKWSDAKKML